MDKRTVLSLMKDDVKSRKNKIRKFIMDKKNSFKDRLEVFLATPEHLYSHSQWVIHLPKIEKKYDLNWYNDFYTERHSVVDLVEMIKDKTGDWFLLDDDLDYEEPSAPRDYPEKLDEEKFNLFVNEVLDTGYHSFTFDW